ncbi:hypothetical protein DFO45_5006 [Azorhizobium sp. AG788]|nr:hypothetical protein DFO45_5006 [Azorhizobium sp. AG788]
MPFLPNGLLWPDFAFLDFEANGLHYESYPVEVGCP